MSQTRAVAKHLLFSLGPKDFEIQTFRSGGKGGQHQNTTDSGVRIIHPASGARGESRSERSQYQNRKLAFRHLVDSVVFRAWHKVECAKRLGEPVAKTPEEIEREVDEMIRRDLAAGHIVIETSE